MKSELTEGFFNRDVQLPGRLLDSNGVLQLSSMLEAYAVGSSSVEARSQSAKRPKDFVQGALVELIHSHLFSHREHWGALGINSLELVIFEFCLEKARDELALPYALKIDLIKMLSCDRGMRLLPSSYLNLAEEDTFELKTDELFEVLHLAFARALRERRPFETGATHLDAYVSDMISTLNTTEGNP